MENNQVEKSQAELYREERKKRMASAAKKSARKSPQAAKVKKVIGKVIAVVLAVVIGVAALYGVFNFFGLPQKVLTAAKIGDERISVAKYNFYYMDLFLSVSNQSASYDSQYGSGYGAMYTGYDTSKTPMEQEYTETLEGFDGESPTWADYFRITTLENLQVYTAYAKLARDAGLTLDEEELADIDEQIESMRSTAESNDYSLDRFLAKRFGKGVDEKLLREVMEERQLAANYAQQKQTEVTDSITDEQIVAEYDANTANYALLSVHGFVVAADTSSLADDATDDEKAAATTEAMAKAKEQADAYAAKVNSPETLYAQAKAYNDKATETSVKLEDVTAANLASAFGDTARDWAIASDRAVGDVTVLESANGYAVVYMAELPHKDVSKPVDVRHVLVQFDSKTDSDGKAVALTDSEKAVYYQQAEALYKQFLENPTEENFATIANTNSDDTGSNTNGGLYEDVHVGDMVTAFNDWCFDPVRKPGDSGIIETNYGYHIMYYVGNDNEETWKSDVRNSLASAAYMDFDKGITEGETYKVSDSKWAIKWCAAQLENLITTTYIQY